MASEMSWGLYGQGLIGSELKKQVGKEGVAARLHLSPAPEFVVRSSGVYEADGKTPLEVDVDDLPTPDVTFLTIPSTDSGQESMAVLERVLGEGRVAITAEKGGIANNFAELREMSDNFARLGIRATVGGGARLIPIAREFCRDRENVTQLHGVLNGTMTAIYSLYGGAGQGGAIMTSGLAVDQAIKLGYAEPGASSPNEVIKGEATGDIPKKTAILFNAAGLSDDILNWQDLQFELTDEEIDRSLAEARVRRFIVSLFHNRHKKIPDTDIIGGFEHEHDGWTIVGGFQDATKNPLLAPLLGLSQASNGLVIGLGPDELDGVYVPTGPGAGPQPTVNAMLDDLLVRTDKSNDLHL